MQRDAGKIALFSVQRSVGVGVTMKPNGLTSLCVEDMLQSRDMSGWSDQALHAVLGHVPSEEESLLVQAFKDGKHPEHKDVSDTSRLDDVSRCGSSLAFVSSLATCVTLDANLRVCTACATCAV